MLLSLCAGPLRSVFGSDELAAEPLPELLGVGPLCEAEDGHVEVVLTIRVAAAAE